MLSFLFRCVSAVIIFKARMRCHFFPEHIAQQKLHTTNKQTHKAPLKHFTVSRVRYHKNLSLSWLCKFILTHLILQTHAVRLALPQCSPPSEKRNISLMGNETYNVSPWSNPLTPAAWLNTLCILCFFSEPTQVHYGNVFCHLRCCKSFLWDIYSCSSVSALQVQQVTASEEQTLMMK